VGESVVINDPDGEFKVTAFDANHCPGIFFLYYDDDDLVCFIIDF
jgi:DNA cross-link repair 1A protein